MALKMWKTAADRGIVPSMPHDQRRAQRRPIAVEEMANLLRTEKSRRWRYFLNETCGQEEVWVIFDADQRLFSWCDEKNSLDLVPVWPRVEFAELFLKRGQKATPIPMVDVIDGVFPVLVEEGFQLAIFPLPDVEFEILAPIGLSDEWENHWMAYLKSHNA
ncbi:MAG: DUF2750 domain-containing protein [Pelagimonas sp.]|jgi:hypothetical protein|nr:DUF2750 domain-containing protein [Pelagimonas sp.]